MSEKILFVDDDTRVLRSFTRYLTPHFNIATASSGATALEMLQSSGPFAVIVADMRMPAMNGITLLRQVRQQSPHTVRMMLTGNADLQTAVNAVNEGHIFRFMTKPCPIATLSQVLESGLEQYRLIMAEKELLGQTLKGSINVLTEILSMVSPAAFSRTSRVRQTVRDICCYLGLSNVWQYELAAMLSQIGCVSLPPGVLDKVFNRIALTDDEYKMYRAHPDVGKALLTRIPRLEGIAEMIRTQQAPAATPLTPKKLKAGQEVVFGAQLLKLATDFDEQLMLDLSADEALSVLQSRTDTYNPHLLNALKILHSDDVSDSVKEVTVHKLTIGMIADEDIMAESGLLLVTKGQEITPPVLIRLQNFAGSAGVVEPFRVRLPE